MLSVRGSSIAPTTRSRGPRTRARCRRACPRPARNRRRPDDDLCVGRGDGPVEVPRIVRPVGLVRYRGAGVPEAALYPLGACAVSSGTVRRTPPPGTGCRNRAAAMSTERSRRPTSSVSCQAADDDVDRRPVRARLGQPAVEPDQSSDSGANMKMNSTRNPRNRGRKQLEHRVQVGLLGEVRVPGDQHRDHGDQRAAGQHGVPQPRRRTMGSVVARGSTKVVNVMRITTSPPTNRLASVASMPNGATSDPEAMPARSSAPG